MTTVTVADHVVIHPLWHCGLWSSITGPWAILRIFQSGPVLQKLLQEFNSYGADFAGKNVRATKDLSWQNKHFFTTCLRKITWIFWPDRIVPTTNSWKPLRKHHWIPSWGEGDSIRSVIPRLRMETSAHARIALRCTPEGTRKRESLCCRWRRAMLNKAVMVWSAAVKNLREPGQVRDGWRNLVEALCATRHEDDEWLWVIVV